MKTRPPSPRTAPVAGRNGIALIIVLWTLLGLTAIAVAYAFGQAAYYREVEGRWASAQARLAAETLLDVVENILAGTEPSARASPPDLFRDAIAIGNATVWLIARSGDGALAAAPTFGWTDEAAKLSLNAPTGGMLAGLPGMDAELDAAVAAWRRPAADGAAAAGKGAPFETVEELRLVPGFTAELLYGADRNRNGAADAAETEAAAGAPFGLADYLTTGTREPAAQADGTSRVSVNGPRPLLEAYLGGILGDARGRDLAARIAAGGRNYRSVLEAAKRAGFTRDEFARTATGLVHDTAPFRVGVVNVNTAPAAVLACVPGIGAENAARIAAQRASAAEPEPTLAWVLELLDEAACAAAGPWLTAQTHQVSADAAAIGPNGRGYARIRIVYDFSDAGAPRRVYRRELSHLGGAMGTAARRAALGESR